MYKPSLLDTDILSELFKGHGAVISHASGYISQYGYLTISQIAKYEILKGLKSKKAQKQTEIFNRFCSVNTVLPITDDVIVRQPIYMHHSESKATSYPMPTFLLLR